jgi:hypothetical protein
VATGASCTISVTFTPPGYWQLYWHPFRFGQCIRQPAEDSAQRDWCCSTAATAADRLHSSGGALRSRSTPLLRCPFPASRHLQRRPDWLWDMHRRIG